MVYAVIHKDTDWPDGFEEIAWLANRIKRYGYTVNVSTKIFAGQVGVPYKVSIVKWERFQRDAKREEVGTYEDKKEAANMIRFLLNVLEEQHRERN